MDKMLKFYVKVFFKVMGKVLSGELSQTHTCLGSNWSSDTVLLH